VKDRREGSPDLEKEGNEPPVGSATLGTGRAQDFGELRAFRGVGWQFD